MARPAKSVKVKSGAMAQEEAEVREKVEDGLRGSDGPPEAPELLTEDQRAIFNNIVDLMKGADILGKADVYVLESTAVAIDRIHTINAMVDLDITNLANTALQNTRAKYQSDLWRGCNELCLSPQARAKLGSMAAQAARKERDPLLDALMDDD